MLECSTICACIPHLPANLSSGYSLWYKGAPFNDVNVSVDGFCTLMHEIPTNTSWQSRNSKDVLRVLLNTYLAPPIILVTLVTNLLICAVLTRRHMISPTNIILLAMAIVDMLTGTFPLPWYLLPEFAHQWTIDRVCSSAGVANLANLMTTTLPPES